jgi:Domain of unknown function (DUF1844)
MADPDAEATFKVTDRRRRDEDEAPSVAARPEPRASDASRAPIIESPRDPSPPPPEGVPERSLVGLLMMLGSEALIALGEAADPVTGQRHRELPHAAGVIDLLLLLREKTEGNRTPEETQVVDELVYDLQLRYVNAMKRPG